VFPFQFDPPSSAPFIPNIYSTQRFQPHPGFPLMPVSLLLTVSDADEVFFPLFPFCYSQFPLLEPLLTRASPPMFTFRFSLPCMCIPGFHLWLLGMAFFTLLFSPDAFLQKLRESAS